MKRRTFFASTVAAAFGSASALAQTASSQFKFPENVDENAVTPLRDRFLIVPTSLFSISASVRRTKAI